MHAPQELLLAATSHGLATCPMEGFDMRRLRKALRIPLRYSIPIVVCIGYPSEAQRDFKTLRCALQHLLVRIGATKVYQVQVYILSRTITWLNLWRETRNSASFSVLNLYRFRLPAFSGDAMLLPTTGPAFSPSFSTSENFLLICCRACTRRYCGQ